MRRRRLLQLGRGSSAALTPMRRACASPSRALPLQLLRTGDIGGLLLGGAAARRARHALAGRQRREHQR